MLAAGVPGELGHPHVLRHTYGSLYMTHHRLGRSKAISPNENANPQRSRRPPSGASSE